MAATNQYLILVCDLNKDKKFYVGEVLEDRGVIGVILLPASSSDVKLFTTYGDAHTFAIENGFDKSSHIKFYIKDEQDLKDSRKRIQPKEKYYIVSNDKGQKIFWSDIDKCYYWGTAKAGYIVAHQAWLDFWIPVLKLASPFMKIIVTPLEDNAIHITL